MCKYEYCYRARAYHTALSMGKISNEISTLYLFDLLVKLFFIFVFEIFEISQIFTNFETVPI